MNIHSNARLTAFGREQIVRRAEAGETLGAIASTAGVSPACVRKWIRRYKAEGLAGLADRSSRPRRLRVPTPQAKADQVEALRRTRLPFWKTALATGLSRSTVARIGKHTEIGRAHV